MPIPPRLSPMESFYGSFGNPTSVDRQRLYAEQQGALRGAIQRGEASARRDAAGAASTAMGGGNPFLAGRVGARAGGDAAARVQSQGVAQQAQLSAQQMAQEQQAREAQGQWAQHTIGGLLGAGGQVLGSVIPMLGAARGVAGATGISGALGQSGNPVGQMLGSALGAPQQTQAPQMPMAAPTQPAPAPAPQVDASGLLPGETPEQRDARLRAQQGMGSFGPLSSVFGGGLSGIFGGRY